MLKKDEFLLPFSLLLLIKFLRNIGYGIFSLLFFQRLFSKGFIIMDVLIIQVSSMVGVTIVSWLCSTFPALRSVKTLILAYLLKLATALIYLKTDSITLMIITNLLGLLPVTGQQHPLIESIQSTITWNLINKSKIQSKYSQLIQFGSFIKHFSQSFGCFLVGYFIKDCNQVCLKLNILFHQLTVIYCFICAAELILIFLFKYYNSQDSLDLPPSFSIKQNQYLFFGGLKSFAEVCLTNSYLPFFFYSRYVVLKYFKICFILAGKNLLEALSPYLLQLSLFIFKNKITIFLNYVSILLLFLMTTDHAYVSIGAMLGYLLAYSGLKDFDVYQSKLQFIIFSKNQQSGIDERRANQLNSDIVSRMGLTLGLIFNSFFIMQPTYNLMFVFPFANLAIIKIILKACAYYVISTDNIYLDLGKLSEKGENESESILESNLQNNFK